MALAKIADQPGKPQGYEESGSVSRDIPGIGFSAYTSDYPNHTYEMNQDNLKPVGHNGFIVQAQAMAALLQQFAIRPDLRAAVKKEFDGTKALFGDYLKALEKTYTVPVDEGVPRAPSLREDSSSTPERRPRVVQVQAERNPPDQVVGDTQHESGRRPPATKDQARASRSVRAALPTSPTAAIVQPRSGSRATSR